MQISFCGTTILKFYLNFEIEWAEFKQMWIFGKVTSATPSRFLNIWKGFISKIFDENKTIGAQYLFCP